MSPRRGDFAIIANFAANCDSHEGQPASPAPSHRYKMTEHRGRVVKNTGDRMLADFSSVVDAVRCAVDVQRRRAAKVTRGGAAALVGVDLGECPYDYEESWGRYPSHIVTSRFGGSEC
jgi:hypothetical protein